MNDRQVARRKLTVYLILVFALSLLFYFKIAQIGDLNVAGMWVLGLVWMPALAAIITALIFQRNIRGFGWGPGKIKYLIYGYVIPLLYTSAAYAIIWLTGLGKFSGGDGFISALLNGATLGVLQAMLLALGEEIGWRGFMVPLSRSWPPSAAIW